MLLKKGTIEQAMRKTPIAKPGTNPVPGAENRAGASEKRAKKAEQSQQVTSNQ
jgi:hypothetical protein